MVATSLAPDSTAISYAAFGRGDTALVFIHGWAGDQGVWAKQVPYFARKTTVITLDLAGHGRSGRSRRAWSVQNFAADVAAVVRAVKPSRIVLIGHSLGGPVAIEAALLLREKCVAVVGIDTFFDVWATSQFAEVLDKLRANFPTETRAFVRHAMFTPRSDSALATRVADAMASAPPDLAVPSLASLQPWARDRFAAAVAAIRVPIGVLQASSAGHTMLERQRASLHRLELDSVPGSGHFLMLEEPERFNMLLDSLLQRASR